MPEARQNKSKLAEMFERASSFSALVGMAVDVVTLFMALLSFVESAPRAYRLKASNAAQPISTSSGTISQTSNVVLITQNFCRVFLLSLEARTHVSRFSRIHKVFRSFLTWRYCGTAPCLDLCRISECREATVSCRSLLSIPRKIYCG